MGNAGEVSHYGTVQISDLVIGGSVNAMGRKKYRFWGLRGATHWQAKTATKGKEEKRVSKCRGKFFVFKAADIFNGDSEDVSVKGFGTKETWNGSLGVEEEREGVEPVSKKASVRDGGGLGGDGWNRWVVLEYGA